MLQRTRYTAETVNREALRVASPLRSLRRSGRRLRNRYKNWPRLWPVRPLGDRPTTLRFCSRSTSTVTSTHPVQPPPGAGDPAQRKVDVACQPPDAGLQDDRRLPARQRQCDPQGVPTVHRAVPQACFHSIALILACKPYKRIKTFAPTIRHSPELVKGIKEQWPGLFLQTGKGQKRLVRLSK